ncbi:MAG: carboxypeptidase-like regulatory domain-containing protein [Flavobacteriaceae bacterium]
MRIILKNSIKNYRNLSAVILFILAFHAASAQITISGKVIDEHGDPLPFVHLRVENTNLGTISNENGLFRLVLRKDIEKNDIVISSVGYKTKKIYLKEGNHTIILTSNVTELEEVTVITMDFGKELIRKAINAIPQNYPKIEERHKGFFREIIHWGQEEKPAYIIETTLESIKKPYKIRRRSGDVKLNEFRKYESQQLDSLYRRIYAGAHHIHRFDIVSRREAFLGNPSGFKYKIKDTLRQRGNDVYKIYFQNKNKLSGHVYVMDSSYAIIKAELNNYSYSKSSLKGRQYLNYTVTYEQDENQVWRFKRSNYETAFKQRGKLFKLSSNYVTTEVEPNKIGITYSDRLQFGDILLYEPKKYEPNFWDSYNIILPDEKSENLFRSIDYSKTNNAKKTLNKFLRILLRLRQEAWFTWTSIDIASNMVVFENPALEIQQGLSTTEENVYGLTYSLLYEFKPNFFLGYSNESSISKSGITSHDLSISRSINLNPNGRPIFVIPRVNFGYQELKYSIGNFKNTGDFKINGISFKNGETDVFLSQRNIRLQPNLVFDIEKSNRLSFMVSFGYNFPLKERIGLLFHEKDGFFLFRKKTFIKNGDESLSIERSNGSLKNNISISAGIAIHI